MKIISLGRQRLKVPVVGLGCKDITKPAHYDDYGNADVREAISTIHRSLELGANFLFTAGQYDPFENEHLIGKAIKGRRDKYIISTHWGYGTDGQEQLKPHINGKGEYPRKAVERSLKNLGTDYIDLYFLEWLDPATPIEETMQSMTKLIREGKIGYIGLSNVSSSTILKAQKIHPVAAVQLHYSLFERPVKKTGILETLQDLGIGLISDSPMGRGVLPENKWTAEMKKIADEKCITVSQLAIAWAICKGSIPLLPIHQVKYLEQLIAAANLPLSATDMSRLETMLPLQLSTHP
jgi:aryl-alcohol dehydrogenase-like predicted oxidoreductase